jgi:phosphoglycolate phosphatase
MRTVRFGQRLFETELIIFDKDGTLTDFKKTWIPILETRLHLILETLGIRDEKRKSIMREIRRSYGVSGNNVDAHGPLPFSTPWEDEVIFTSVLYRFGVPWLKAKDAAHRATQKAEELIDRLTISKLYDGVPELLNALRDGGILVSMATADLSSITVQILKHLKIFDLFDYIVGADMVEKDKPDPAMILKCVDELRADRKRTVLVGDSIVDMEMGRRAEIGLVVGILEGGVATQNDLEKDADVVIESVRDIKPF